MCTEVYKHQHIETGGSLFGLWTTSGSAVIHVVLGPGKNCKRTTASFHQDIEYLHRVGRFVNDNYMLCHIGEWHSHHSLSLDIPSSGDEQTIRGNFPQGVTKFLVIIANIKNRNTIVLSPYFFTDEGKRYEIAEYVVLRSDGPFSAEVKIKKHIELGAEYQQTETSRSGAITTAAENPRNTHSDSQPSENACPTYAQALSRDSREKSHNVDLNTHPSRGSDIISTNSPATSTDSQSSGKNASGVTPMETSDTESQTGGLSPPTDHTSASTTNHSPESSTVRNQAVNDENKATQKDVVLKDVYDHLQKFFGSEGKVEIERTRYGDVQMKFEHAKRCWLIRFPESFPNQPAQIFNAFSAKFLATTSPCYDYYLEKPVTNHVNILLSIKKNCKCTCKICENITKKNLTKLTEMRPVSTKVAGVVNELTNEIQMTLSTPFKFSREGQTDGSYRIEFEHSFSKWSIQIPAEFPDKPAEVHKLGSRYGAPEKKTINRVVMGRQEEKPLISSELITLAITSNCYCSECHSKK